MIASKKTKRSVGAMLLLVFCVVVFLFSGYQILSYFASQKETTDLYQGIRHSVFPEKTPAASAAGKEDVPEQTKFDFDALLSLCPDGRAWLSLPGTTIDYPVVQGKNNSYYLAHSADGKKNGYGAVFMDCANSPDFQDQNTVVYAHRVNFDAMFTPLLQYLDQDFYAAHPSFLLYTPKGNYKLQVFAASVVNTNQMEFTKLQFAPGEFAAYLEKMQALSAIQTNVSVSEEDRIVTMVTCTKANDENRVVVQAKMVP